MGYGARPGPRSAGRSTGGGPRRSGGGGSSGTRSMNLTTAQILKRFAGGPDTGVFTDGSCAGNPGPGGWGAVYVRGGVVLAQEHGADPATTNNRMEFTAMIAGLRFLGPADEAEIGRAHV